MKLPILLPPLSFYRNCTQRQQKSRMYRYKQKKGKKKERSIKTSLNSLALHNARTFKSLSLRVRCIWVPLFLLLIVDEILF